MKIGVLTSSRADYGIYKSLLLHLQKMEGFEVEPIAFGMHLEERHGRTISEIQRDEWSVIHEVTGTGTDDSVKGIAKAYAQVVGGFSEFWANNRFDLVFALGDRWEMSAAVQAAIPFEIKIAHFHGGETTLGAVDNIYRHQISLASTYHFVATEIFAERVKEITGATKVYNVGAMSIENIQGLALPEWSSVKAQFEIPFDDFVLVTFHPESVHAERNKEMAELALEFLEQISVNTNVLITRANADVMGMEYNDRFESLESKSNGRVKLVTSLGKLNYFSAMQHCQLMVGNTSSGIIEAASLGSWVLNVGDRQAGRLRNDNTIDVPFNLAEMKLAFEDIAQKGPYVNGNRYYKNDTLAQITHVLDSIK